MNIVCLDDDEFQGDMLKNEIDKWAESRKADVFIQSYTSGEQYFALRENAASKNIDIFFLDIQMKDISGVDVAKKLREEGYDGFIVFLTSYDDYVFSGYEVQAFNYLKKPICEEALISNLDKMALALEKKIWVIESKSELVRIPYQDIICVSSSGHRVEIMTLSDVYSKVISFSEVCKQVPKYFVQTHRSYIVNMNHIHKITNNTIFLSNKKTVPLARTYKGEFMLQFTKNVFKE